jgi:hypothetical protein
VSWFQLAFDFAVAYHFAAAGTATSLATFDQAFIKVAQAD